MPKISVIVRVHSYEEYVEEALYDIINQDFDDYEILIIDDNSNDKIKQILHKYKDNIRIIETEGIGLVKAANIGFKNSTGEYVILLDSDDKFKPKLLKELYDNRMDADFIYSDYIELMDNGTTHAVSLKNNLYNGIAAGILFKKNTIEKLGCYDENLILPEYDLIIKLNKNYKGIHVNLPLYIYRRHDKSITANREMMKKGILELKDKYADISQYIKEPINYKFLGIGLGSIGQRHFNNFNKLYTGELIAYRERGRELQNIDENTFSTFYSLEEAFNQNPDAALITNPTSYHIPYAIEAAKRKCHLFIEKPLSHNMDGVNELIKLINKYKLKTLIGCNLRFHPCIIHINDLIHNDTIGDIIYVHTQFGTYLPDWHPWEEYTNSYPTKEYLGGGAILTNVHELDYLYWFFGNVNKVFCHSNTNSKLEMEVEDNADIILKFNNNAIGHVHIDFFSRPYSRRCEIMGECGSITWDFNYNQVKIFKNNKWKTSMLLNNFDFNDTYIDEMKHFVNCLRDREKSINDINEGKKVLQIALAAKKSSEEETWIKI